MKEKFQDITIGKAGLALIGTINDILTEYEALGYDLTLRQLYYQLVSRDFVPNTVQSYKRVGDIVSNGRLAGLIDWEMIADRGRTTVWPAHWEHPGEILSAAAQQFKVDKWRGQINHVEIMVEKQALEGILAPVCAELDVRFTANKGYSSSSAMYEIGKRLAGQAYRGKSLHVLYLGDHDPSGIDMTRDVKERLEQFSGRGVNVERLALNMNQVEELDPPENPAKTTDSRFAAYEAEFGESSWELDAVEPRRLSLIVTEAVLALRDETIWEKESAREQRYKAELTKMADKYNKGEAKS